MTNIRTRLDKLENHAKPGIIVMWQHHTETNDQTKSRWKAEHPGEDPDRVSTRVVIVGWGDPQPSSSVTPPVSGATIAVADRLARDAASDRPNGPAPQVPTSPQAGSADTAEAHNLPFRGICGGGLSSQ